MNMLDYAKTIVKKVSFDPLLFEKELKKAIKSLIPKEIIEFKNWCYHQFGQRYSHILDQCFIVYH